MAEKTPLVLLPGLLNDEILWRHQSETLSDAAEIAVTDLTLDDSIAGMARRVLREAPKTFALAGFSMGGYTAFEIMRTAPERVERLALVATSARADAPERTQLRHSLIEMAEKGRFEEAVERVFRLAVHESRVADPAVAGPYWEMARRVGPEAFVRQQRAIMGRPDSRKDLGAIRCPTLVLVGRQDQSTPLEVHVEIANGIPGAPLVIIEDCGHLSPVERPRTVSALLRYWLARG
jgi:pimeloyl-ACP methyl ester carboxylesterase